MKTNATRIMNLFCFGAGLLLLFSALSALAAEPPKEPILGLEVGMHTAPIRGISVDAENRFLVTGSDDKTVRIWELPDLRLIRTLRPPIDEGNEGKIFAVAISPDGSTIVAGGWTGWEWEQKASIYLFDRVSGRMTRPKAMQGLPMVTDYLVYSIDGKYLTACLDLGSGIRIYRTADYTLIKEDTDYLDRCYGAAFSQDGRLVTVSFDGFIRLYDENFTRICKVQAPGGKNPYSVSFSPDGKKIAVGYLDTIRVDVLSGNDLTYLFSPDTSDLKNVKDRNLCGVAWSTDGVLYAGGTYNPDSSCVILKWTLNGTSRYQALTASSDTIPQILSLKAGAIAFGTYDPAFGIFDYTGTRTHYTDGLIAVFRESLNKFLVSHDGTIVQFGFELWGESPARFDIKDRLLTVDPSGLGSLNPPATKAEGLMFEDSDWKDTDEPKLNGTPLRLKKYEKSESLAVCPDGQGFLLGTNWHLRFFDKSGTEKWDKPIPIPGIAWAINISGDGKVAVAALGDGTIRWFK